MSGRIDFDRINAAALALLPVVLSRCLPNGRPIGFVALNPRRADKRLSSFKVNLRTGHWADFATGDKGGDPVSLVAFVEDLPQGEAARRVAQMFGIETGGRCHR